MRATRGTTRSTLAGLLADEGLVLPDKIGVTGASYGGGQSMILAALKNRTMLADGSLVAWKSPKGLDMTIAAAAPLIPWSDLAYSLTPTGRMLDYRVDNPYGLRGGIQKVSWNNLLYTAGLGTGFYAPTGVDFAADISAWNARIAAGEPYDGDSTLENILDEITAHHSAYYIDDTVEPAPLFIYNAWTDDLFPVDEALRYWRKTRAKYPNAEIALLFADDFGHSRANLGFAGARASTRVDTFFARHLKGAGDALPALETYTQACNGATVEGPFLAADWDSIHPGEVRFSSRRSQRFDSSGGKTANAMATNPLNGGPCRTVAADDDPNAATYRLPAASVDGYTLLGAPTVIAELAATGPNAQVVARLWDMAPDGMQTLVTHTLYRPRADNRGPQVFQLHPNAWRFAAGHAPKLELLGQSSPYGRASNGYFIVTVSRLELRLPVREAPGGRMVKTPAGTVLPPSDAEPTGCDLTPRAGCQTPPARGAAIAIALHGRSARGRIDWRWNAKTGSTAVDFGNPTTSTDYALCVYDGNATLVASALAPAAATCRGKSCWAKTRTGFRYADAKSGTGIRSVTLAVTPKGTVSTRLTAGGARLGVPALPVAGMPLTAQLVNGNGACWSAAFGSARKNSARLLKAVSD